MKGTGRGRGRGKGNSGRDGAGGGLGNFRERECFGTTSQPPIQQIRVDEVSLETRHTPNPSQGRLQVKQISSDPLQRTSPGTQSSRNLEESIRLSLEVEIGAISRINRKRGRGKYKSKTVDIKTKYGGKIKVIIPYDIDRAVGSGARDIVNYAGLIMRSSISFQDGNWQNIVSKHGEAMWYKVKDKFEVSGGLRAHKFQGFVISTMQRLFRAWKARLHNHYCAYSTDEDRLSNRPEEVELEDWNYLVKYFGSEKFKVISERNKNNREKQITKHSCGTRSFAEVEESTRDPLSGEIDSPDKVWEIQHTRKSTSGERSQLKQLVAQQQSEEIKTPMTRDVILSSVLGERSGYVRGKGYGKKPPKKDQIQQADIEASVSSAMESMLQEMQVDIERKLQEEREHMAADLKRSIDTLKLHLLSEA
ncbi:hypothetical protein KY290_012760 [Solanum tuberosum]|uniref:Uncharacterized protein n=1 Tax=Solanum tuberosum TaxID=4113 RepID=A0ABQ7VM13_SOLTU|nr:hypothetical protein KY285_012631 [Solanum tuberosum]KAH0768779.1 hypothetical protein KY290_012760 [Solanum tuberosum]